MTQSRASITAEQHRAQMKALGLQPVFCETRIEPDGRSTPVPLPRTIGKTVPYGVDPDPPATHDRLAFRVPPGAVVLDVDRKNGRDGVVTLQAMELDLGFLPNTQRLTSRGADQPTGRLLFRVPAGTPVELMETWIRTYGTGIDVLHAGHRFSMAPGDRNPNSGDTEVRCYGPDGTEQAMDHALSWPELPQEWIEALDEWAAQEQLAKLPRVGDGVVSTSHGKAMIAKALQRVMDESGGPEYRSALMKAAKTLGGFVGTLLSEEQALEELHKAVWSVWAADPWPDEHEMIRSGLEMGADEPFTIDESADDVAPAGLFDSTPVLTHILQAARARQVSPMSMLCYLLGRVALELPPQVCIPPYVGAKASLNVAFALVGKSGAGKSVMEAASADVLSRDQDALVIGPGSGEGLIETFLDTKTMTLDGKKVTIKTLTSPPARLLLVDEIKQLDAIQSRSGSTMAPLLRTSLTGGALSTTTASADTTRHVPAGVYRLVAIAGVQPENADVLFRDADSGTPQRWVWVPTNDPGAPDEPPEWPGALEWSPAFVEPWGDEYPMVDFPEHVAQEVRANRTERLRSGQEKLDGHWLLTRMKVAALLAALHQQLVVDDLLWGVSEQIMRVSDRERDRCLELYQGRTERELVVRKRAESSARAEVESDQMQKAVEQVVKKLRKHEGEELSWRDARPSHRLRVGLDTAEIIDELRGQVGVEITESMHTNSEIVWSLKYVG